MGPQELGLLGNGRPAHIWNNLCGQKVFWE
jgi:hypothetical protein